MYASDVKISIKQPRAFISWTACNPDLFSQRASKLFRMHPTVQDTPVVVASKKAPGRPTGVYIPRAMAESFEKKPFGSGI